MFNIRPIEIFLIQFIIYIFIWLVNDYVGSFISVIIPIIALFILAISLVADKIERSNVPKMYYTVMVISILTPILVGAIFIYLFEGDFDWLHFFPK